MYHNVKKTKRFLSMFLSFILLFGHFSGFLGVHVQAAGYQWYEADTEYVLYYDDDVDSGEESVDFYEDETREILYSLRTDSGIQNLEIGVYGPGNPILNDSPHLAGSGTPVFTIVEHPETGNSLQISERAGDWHTVDLVRESLGLDSRNTYTVTFEGRVLGGRSGAQVQISRTGGNWSPFVSVAPAADGTFTIALVVNADIHAELAELGGNGFRIRTNGNDDFIIDEITVSRPRTEDVDIPDPGVGTLTPAEITLAPNRVRGFEIEGFGVDRYELSWELSGNVSPNTTIVDGFLSIAEDNPFGTIVVRAYVTENPEVYGIAVVTVGGASVSIIHGLPAGLNFDAYPSLREVYADYFLMGVAGDTGQINNTALGQLRAALVGHHYNSWSFENSMKVQPLRGNNAANRLQPVAAWPGLAGPTNTMNAARAAYPGMSFAGHTTAWHSQSPDWMWDRHAGGTANRQVGLENLQHHIRGTFEQFGTQISSMDVVNEAIGSVNPADPGNWREALTRGEGWSPTLGYYWVMYAFIFAAEIVDELDLDVTLYYNDFLLHTANKGYSVYRMVREINEMHAAGEVIHPMTGEVFQRPNGQLLIEGIGMQDRQSGVLDIDGFSNAINMFAELGVLVAITEMDLSWRISSPDGLLTPEEQIAQGQQMARFFEMVRRYAAGPATAGSPYPRVVERVTFWGVDDTHSWSPGEPMLFGRPDIQNNTIPGKEALRAVLDPHQFLEDHPWFPEEMPPVPGVHIFDLAENGFTGANIILGNDADVWPFSTAADDETIAYVPQPGATYRLLVRYQTFGTYGLEAHWLADNSADNFTDASAEAALTMGTITRGSGAGPVANGIPTRFFNPGVGGSFAWLETTFTMSADALPGGLLGNIALRGINGGNEFGIYSIEITRINPDGDDTLLVNYPFLVPLVRPEVPGIIVPEPNDAENNGRADVIIGSGRDVWPFADGHESGVAFDPVPGTTYRIMFNIRTTGAGGWRVRWIPGTGGEDYTTADGAVVNSYPLRVSSFGLGVPTPDLISAMPVASFIPSHPNSGVSAAGVYTVVQDITLDGDEAYQGLIGNIALRGTGGSGNFVVNWISVQELAAGPGSEAVETLSFWPFGVDAFDAFSADPIAYIEASEGFANDHFSPNVLNVANNSLMPITRQVVTPVSAAFNLEVTPTNEVINAANPPLVGDTLVAGRISGGTGTGSGLRTGVTQGFLAGNAQYDWIVGGEVVQTGTDNTFVVLPAHAGQTIQVRMSSDWETGYLTSAATPAVYQTLEAAWSFATVYDEMRVASDALPELAIDIHLDNVTNVAGMTATYQWFARLATGAAHATGVPIGSPNEINLEQAVDGGFTATLQLVNEFGVIPLTPAPATPPQNLAVLTEYVSENWEYFVVVVHDVPAIDGELVRSTEAENDAVISVVVDHVDFVRNRPPRDYFPNVRDLVDDITVMPLERYLNDPFIFFEYLMGGDTLGTDGRVVTEEDWWERNAEIRDLVEYYWFGMLPYVPLENITITVPTLNINDTTTATTQLTGTIRSNGRVVTGHFGTITMPSRAQIEASAFNLEDGIPVVIGGNAGFYTSHGIATLAAGGVTNAQLHPANNNITEFNTGSIMNTVWTSSRGLDALQILFERNGYGVDPEKSATIGVSIGGKQAMFRGVMDERVALTVPVESGAFGMTHMRNLVEGYIPIYEGHSFAAPWMRAQKPMNSWGFTGEAGWFAFEAPPGFIHPFGARVHPDYSTYRIPFDMHLVAALAAPRGLLSFDNDGTGSGNGWMNPFGQQLVIDAAREVYAFLGVEGNIGGRVRDQAHTVQARDNPFVAATLIAMFGNDNNVGTGREMGAVGPIDVNESVATNLPGLGNPPAPAYGFGVYASINDMGITPFEVQSRFIQWARPGYHSVWTHTEVVTEGLPAVIEAHTTAPDGTVVELLHWSHGSNNRLFAPELLETVSAVVENGVAVFEIEGNVGRYELRLVEVNARASAFFSGIDINTAVRSGASPGTSHMYRSFGFTSRINMDVISIYVANADGDEFYLPAVAIEEAQDARVPQGWGGNVTAAAGAWGGWIMEYGVGIPNQGAPGSANNRLFNNGAVILRNVQLEAMPGYTFEVSFQSGGTNGNPINSAVLWPSSTAVQASQAFPHWPPAGGLTAAGGESGPFGIREDNTRAFREAPTTDFDAELTHSLSLSDDRAEITGWVVDFDQPMNPRDFGVGFNFTDDFTLVWSDDATQVTFTFNDMDLEGVDEPEMIIIRLRDAVGNSIATHRRYFLSDLGYHVVTFDAIGAGTVAATIDGVAIAEIAFARTGETVVFTATPDDEIEVYEWTVNGEVVVDDEESLSADGLVLTIINVTESLDVVVEFARITEDIELEVDEDGNVTITVPEDGDLGIDEDGNIVITLPDFDGDEEDIVVTLPEHDGDGEWTYEIGEDEDGNTIIIITPPPGYEVEADEDGNIIIVPADPTEPTRPLPTPPASNVNRGWILVNGQWFYYTDNQRQTGWIQTGRNLRWYFLNPEQGRAGHRAELPIGAMLDGWVRTGGNWYFLNPASGQDGHRANRPHGAMLDGWVRTGGQWYFLNQREGRSAHQANRPHGAMLTGWVRTGGNWYFLNPRSGRAGHQVGRPHGAMRDGLITVGNHTYFLNPLSGQAGHVANLPHGARRTGRIVINDVTYRFNSNGRLAR